MKWLEKFSGTIYKVAARKPLNRFSKALPEQVLKRSLKMLDPEIANEIQYFVLSRQSENGGFMDKAGKSDLYYSLFGNFVAETFDLRESGIRLQTYIDSYIESSKPEGVHLHCAAILISRRPGVEKLPEKINKSLAESTFSGHYSAFLNLLSFYYSRNYVGLFRESRRLRATSKLTDIPCTVVAANLVLQHCFNRPTEKLIAALRSFYMKNGSFAAVKNAPVGDLLSTSVALYALRMAGADMRGIKPECLEYVDSMYIGGGFCATELDPDPDIEYTFYGLLALGALAD